MVKLDSKLRVDNLVFRRQFLISTSSKDLFPEFDHFELNNGLNIWVHPDLEMTEAGNSDLSLVLLGFILDPYHPQKTNQEILEDILEHTREPQEIALNALSYCGRFAMICYDEKKMILFNDPCGYRSIAYYNKKDHCMIASEPGLIAKALCLTEDKNIRKYLENTTNLELTLVGEETVYPDVSVLIPNHYLDAFEKKTHRFYPVRKIEPKKYKTVLKESTELLEKILEAAYARFQLALPVTAGVDSRVMLSALKDKPDIYYFTMQHTWMSDQFQDIKISRELMNKLGKEWNIIRTPAKMSDSFELIYNNCTSTPHPYWGRMAEALLKYFPRDTVSLKGTSSEIARSIYGPYRNSQMTLEKFCNAVKIEVGPSKEPLRKWYNEMIKMGKDFNLEVTDMYHWEIRQGRWQAINQLEWDIVYDTFCPFACRPLIEILLSSKKKYRLGPNYPLHRDIMKVFWKEALDIPINPEDANFKYRMLYHIRNLLIRLDLVSLVFHYKKYKKIFYFRNKLESPNQNRNTETTQVRSDPALKNE